MTPNEARGLFSEYLEGMLDEHVKDRFQACVAAHPETAAELMQFQRTLSTLHRLPPEEPKLDMWGEFAPKMAEYLAEQKQQPMPRLAGKWHSLRSNVSAGMILFTLALAARTRARFGRYLLHEPLQDWENE